MFANFEQFGPPLGALKSVLLLATLIVRKLSHLVVGCLLGIVSHRNRQPVRLARRPPGSQWRRRRQTQLRIDCHLNARAEHEQKVHTRARDAQPRRLNKTIVHCAQEICVRKFLLVNLVLCLQRAELTLDLFALARFFASAAEVVSNETGDNKQLAFDCARASSREL